MKTVARIGFIFLLPLSACDGPGRAVEQSVLASVKAAAGDAPELEFSRVTWCPKSVDGKRAAVVAAVGPVLVGSDSGSGGYFVEVSEDGSVGSAVKVNGGMGQAPSLKALRLDRTYCEGRLVEAPYEAVRQLHDMSMGQ
jgi:hypothetical protein